MAVLKKSVFLIFKPFFLKLKFVLRKREEKGDKKESFELRSRLRFPVTVLAEKKNTYQKNSS